MLGFACVSALLLEASLLIHVAQVQGGSYENIFLSLQAGDGSQRQSDHDLLDVGVSPLYSTVQHALDCAAKLRTDGFCGSSVRDSGTKPARRIDHADTIHIFLRVDETTQCSVLAGSRRAYLDISNLNSLNVVIQGVVSSTCSHANITSNKQVRAKMQVRKQETNISFWNQPPKVLLIRNSSLIVFRHVSFEGNEEACVPGQAKIHLFRAFGVLFYDVIAVQTERSRKLLSIRNSYLIVMRNCTFDGSSWSQRALSPFDDVSTPGEVAIHIYLSDMDCVNETAESRSSVDNSGFRSFLNQLRSAVPDYGSDVIKIMVDGRNRSWHWQWPSFLMTSCTVSSLGGKPSHFNQKLSGTGVKTKNGTSLSLFYKSVQRCFVAVDNTIFTSNRSPFGSTMRVVFLGFGTKQSSENSARISGSQFLGNHGQFAGALLVRFVNSSTESNSVSVDNCDFVGNSATYEGGVASVHFGDESGFRGNRVSFSNCIMDSNKAAFEEHSPTPGGAVSIRSDHLDNVRCARSLKYWQLVSAPSVKADSLSMSKSSATSGRCAEVEFCNCTFENNVGYRTVNVVRANVIFSKRTVIANCSGGALGLRSSKAFIFGQMIISNNQSNCGVAMILEEKSTVDATEAELLQVDMDRFLAADALASSSSYADMLHNMNKPRTLGDCPILFPKNKTVSGNIIKALFKRKWRRPYNSDVAKYSVVSMASLHKCFGYFSSYLNDLYSAIDAKFSVRCYCLPYSPAVWDKNDGQYRTVAPRGDPELQEFRFLRQHYLSHPAYQELCTEQVEGLANMSNVSSFFSQACWRKELCQANSCSPNPTVQHQLCSGQVPNAHLHQPDRCYSPVQGVYVVNTDKYDSRESSVLGTFLAWSFFESATTGCFKPVGKEVWFYHRTCSRKVVIESIFAAEYQLNISTDCILHRLNFLLRRYRRSVTPVLPGYKLLLTPWAGWLNQWHRMDNNANSTCLQDIHGPMVPEFSISNITLNPSPGEKFALKVATRDELLTEVTASLQIELYADHHTVLLGHGKHIYKTGEVVVFGSDVALQNIALYGPPGATGYLQIRSRGQDSYISSSPSFLKLRILFVLRDCYLGFHTMKAINDSVARGIVDAYCNIDAEDVDSTGQQENGMTPKQHGGRRSQVFRLLSCHVNYEQNEACVEKNPDSHHNTRVKIQRGCWAGRIHSTAQCERPPNHVPAPGQNVSLGQDSNCGDDSEFVAGQCDKIECKLSRAGSPKHKIWTLGIDNPCYKWCHCTGTLCSSCLDGFSRLPSTVGCHDCRKAKVKIHLWQFYLLLAFGGLVILTILLFLNIGVSPTLDGWWFFSQLYLEATSNFTWNGAVLVRTLNTLGLGLICQYKSLDGLQAGLTQLLLPPFMILVIVVLWFLARRGIGARLWKFFQRRNSMMQVFWLVILFSASNTAYRSAHLLRWAMIGPHRVVYLESTIGYLSLAHLPYALVALVMLIFAVLPAPILLLWRPVHIWPALKVFIDEATHIYEDDRQWWAAISILRRMLLGLLHAVLPSGPSRRASTAMLLSVILAAQGIFRPYRREARLWRVHDVHNCFEMCSLLILSTCCIAYVVHMDVIGGTEIVTISDIYAGILYGCFTCAALAIGIRPFISSWRNSLLRKPRNTAQNVCAVSELDDDNDDNDNLPLGNLGEKCSAEERRGVPHAGKPSVERSISSNQSSSTGKQAKPKKAVNMDIAKVDTGLRDPLLVDFLA
ncbi:uncharacterized protein LOC135823838 [Sycon ciliatum]|uniref:uncharacterized protein LOC135823838 n=1 Tax=Sycon ciliatum TaxID=27933 RepID=UPI0031F6A2CE